MTVCVLCGSRAGQLKLGDVARGFQLIQWVPGYRRDNLEDGRKVLLLQEAIDDQIQLERCMLR